MNSITKVEKPNITLAKGGILFLVVLSHILSGEIPAGGEGFATFLHFLFLFHMPFFMFIAGFLFFAPGRMERILGKYPSFIKENAIRFLLPFFFMGLLIVSAKVIATQFVHISNTPDNLWDGYINLIWHTKESSSVFLWYIYAYFIFSAASPLLYKFFKGNMIALLMVAATFAILPNFFYFYYDRLSDFYIFFILGGLAIQSEEKFMALLSKKTVLPLCTVLFFSSFLLDYYEILEGRQSRLLTGTLSIPVLFAFFNYASHFKGVIINAFLYIGRHTYIIYLFNTICIGITRAVMFKFTNWDYANLYFFIPVLVSAGLAGPLIAEWLILRHIPFINISILGNNRKFSNSDKKKD